MNKNKEKMKYKLTRICTLKSTSVIYKCVTTNLICTLFYCLYNKYSTMSSTHCTGILNYQCFLVNAVIAFDLWWKFVQIYIECSNNHIIAVLRALLTFQWLDSQWQYPFIFKQVLSLQTLLQIWLFL